MARTPWKAIDPVGKATGVPHRLRLYVAGSTPRSLRAIQNVTRICESQLAGRYDLQVVDIYKEPGRASEDRIVAIPTLIKQEPGLVRRMIGDLSETAAVLRGLDLQTVI
ncbi:MAG TPA: circadian clock KaiB family protein [Bryobacteraceae bacterium]|nr:circadian clock KaiB family protein [Bryobacteraceae bacterium]